MALDERISSMRVDFLQMHYVIQKMRVERVSSRKWKKLVIPKTFSRTKTDARYFEVSLTWLIELKRKNWNKLPTSFLLLTPSLAIRHWTFSYLWKKIQMQLSTDKLTQREKLAKWCFCKDNFACIWVKNKI